MMRIFAPVSQDIWPSGAAAATISYPNPTSHQINMYGNNHHWDRVPRSIPNVKAVRAKTTETVKNKMADKKRTAGIQDGGTGPWIKDLRDSPKPRKKSADKKSSGKSVPKAVQKLPTPPAGKEVEKWKPWKPPDERPGKKKMKVQKEKVDDSKPGGLVAWLADWLTSPVKPMKNSNSTASGERRQEPFNIDLGITFRERETQTLRYLERKTVQ
jgi:hypothetical protein